MKSYTFTPYPKNFSTFFCGFIDDIFFLWNGTESERVKFIDNLNKKYPTIKFEFPYSRISVTFLYKKVYNNQNGLLCTTIYRKPSDRRNFLHYKSVYPKVVKDSITYSQALHIKRIFSETSEVIKRLKDLSSKVVINLKCWTFTLKAVSVDRKILLENKEKPSTRSNLPLVLTFNKTLKHYR